jgi:hypothetical protein
LDYFGIACTRSGELFVSRGPFDPDTTRATMQIEEGVCFPILANLFRVKVLGALEPFSQAKQGSPNLTWRNISKLAHINLE